MNYPSAIPQSAIQNPQPVHRSLGEGGSSDPQGLLYLADRYLEHLRVHNYSPRTLEAHGKAIKYFRAFCQEFGITQARQVTRAVILRYQSYLFHYHKTKGGSLAITTQQHMLGHVIRFFSWLTRESLVLYNPASDLELPRKEFRLPRIIFSAAEAEAVMNVPDVSTPMGVRDRAILEALYSTGIRRMELVNLNREHVDFHRQLLRIEQGKGKKDRYAPIGERALRWVEKYMVEVRPRLCASLNEPALWLSHEGQRLNFNQIGKLVHNLIAAADLGKNGGCHVFRHTFATVLLEAGCNIRLIQEMLGHANLESTQIYTHVSVKALQEAHRKYHPATVPAGGTTAGRPARMPSVAASAAVASEA